jgi:hypothetical protein
MKAKGKYPKTYYLKVAPWRCPECGGSGSVGIKGSWTRMCLKCNVVQDAEYAECGKQGQDTLFDTEGKDGR